MSYYWHEFTPISANIYLAMMENERGKKCRHDPKLKWPMLFKRFMDVAFKNFNDEEKKLNTGLNNSICLGKA